MKPDTSPPLPFKEKERSPEQERKEVSSIFAHLACEAWTAGILTADLDEENRHRFVQFRMTNRWLWEMWSYFDQHFQRPFSPQQQALYLALGLRLTATTHAWPDSPQWRACFEKEPEHWLTRAIWHLCYLRVDQEDPHHLQAYKQAIEEGKSDPKLPGYAEKMLPL